MSTEVPGFDRRDLNTVLSVAQVVAEQQIATGEDIPAGNLVGLEAAKHAGMNIFAVLRAMGAIDDSFDPFVFQRTFHDLDVQNIRTSPGAMK